MIRFVIFTSLLLVTFTTSRGISSLLTDKCSYSSPNYSLNWTYDELSNDVVFKLTAKSNFTNFYTSVGFSNSGTQATDVIAIYVRSGQIGLIDGNVSEDNEIESDDRTNVQTLQFDYQNQTLTAQFARPLESIDTSDADLTNCATFYFPSEIAEIVTGASLEFPTTSNILRVCDIAQNCAVKSHAEVVKREEEAVCESAPETEKNRIQWKPEGDKIRFSVTQNTKKGRWWTAIGVGETMSDMNMIVIFAENGQWKKQGLYRTEGYQVPESYEQNGVDLSRENTKSAGGKLSYDILVNREFLTSKAEENGCITLQIAIVAGTYTPKFVIGKHQTTPTAISVCNLDSCGASSASASSSASPIPPVAEVEDKGEKTEATEKIEEEVLLPSTTTPAFIEIPSTTRSIEPEVEQEVPKKTPTPTLEEVEASGNEPTTLTTSKQVIEENEASGEVVIVTTTTPTVGPGMDESVGSQMEERPLTESRDNDAPQLQATTPEPKVLPIIDLSTTTKQKQESGCGADHEDLKVCESYFDEYLGKVSAWSDRHNMTVSSHMWKACTLLSQVQHVTTMCCTIFRQTCATHLNL